MIVRYASYHAVEETKVREVEKIRALGGLDAAVIKQMKNLPRVLCVIHITQG